MASETFTKSVYLKCQMFVILIDWCVIVNISELSSTQSYFDTVYLTKYARVLVVYWFMMVMLYVASEFI